jgi:hypothetical protein
LHHSKTAAVWALWVSFTTAAAGLTCQFMSAPKATEILRCREMTLGPKGDIHAHAAALHLGPVAALDCHQRPLKRLFAQNRPVPQCGSRGIPDRWAEITNLRCVQL